MKAAWRALGAAAVLGTGWAAAQGPAPLPNAKAEQPKAGFSAVREIDDPATGNRWLLERDTASEGGPGRLVLIAPEGGRSLPGTAAAPGVAGLPVIHAGEQLVVEENTPVVEARLAAVALGTAMPGAALKVRLEMGGRVLEAVAVGPGRAVLAESGARP